MNIIPAPTKTAEEYAAAYDKAKAEHDTIEANIEANNAARVRTRDELWKQRKELDERLEKLDAPFYEQEKVLKEEAKAVSTLMAHNSEQADLAKWCRRIPTTDEEFCEVFRLANRVTNLSAIGRQEKNRRIEEGTWPEKVTAWREMSEVWGDGACDTSKVSPGVSSYWGELIPASPRVPGYTIKGAREPDGSDKEYLIWDNSTAGLIGMLVIDGSSHPGDETQACFILDGRPVKMLTHYDGSNVREPVKQLKWALKRRSMGAKVHMIGTEDVKVRVTGGSSLTGYPEEVDFETTIKWSDMFYARPEVTDPASGVLIPLNNDRTSRHGYKHTLIEAWA